MAELDLRGTRADAGTGHDGSGAQQTSALWFVRGGEWNGARRERDDILCQRGVYCCDGVRADTRGDSVGQRDGGPGFPGAREEERRVGSGGHTTHVLVGREPGRGCVEIHEWS